MNDRIVVSTLTNGTRGLHIFTIQIPNSMIVNENFMEAMNAHELNNPVAWLRCLADQIEAIQMRNNNG